MVIDDNEDICAYVSAALNGAGYEVETAPEGAQALESLHGRAADVVITDLFMPGQEGFETITRCRAEFPHIGIIVISAGSAPGMQHDYLASARLLGVTATLRKPFDADTLLNAVEQVLPPH